MSDKTRQSTKRRSLAGFLYWRVVFDGIRKVFDGMRKFAKWVRKLYRVLGRVYEVVLVIQILAFLAFLFKDFNISSLQLEKWFGHNPIAFLLMFTAAYFLMTRLMIEGIKKVYSRLERFLEAVLIFLFIFYITSLLHSIVRGSNDPSLIKQLIMWVSKNPESFIIALGTLSFLIMRLKVADKQLDTTNKQIDSSNKHLVAAGKKNDLDQYLAGIDLLGKDGLVPQLAGVHVLVKSLEGEEAKTAKFFLVHLLKKHGGPKGEWIKLKRSAEEQQKESGIYSDTRNEIIKTLCQKGESIDLSGLNLNGAKLGGVDLSNITFTGTNLSEADLSNADLSNAKLGRASLKEAKLGSADLSNADLSNAD